MRAIYLFHANLFTTSKLTYLEKSYIRLYKVRPILLGYTAKTAVSFKMK